MSSRETADQSFAANLRALREKAGMSQKDLATAMSKRGVPWHQQTVGRIEAGQQQVRFAEAVEAAAVLKTSLDRLTWTSQEASVAILLDQSIARTEIAYKQIAGWTRIMLFAQRQLETTAGEAERASFHDSDRIKGRVREARDVLDLIPEEAVETGRQDHEHLIEPGDGDSPAPDVMPLRYEEEEEPS